jgi:hypothetical protein
MANRAAFLRSLIALQGERRTGALVVGSAVAQTRIAIAFRDGEVVFATETAPHRKLGRRLVEQRVLSPEAHTQVIETMSRVRAIEEPVRFCDVAVQLRHLTADAAARILADESRQSLARAIVPDDPEWAFEDVSAETRPLIDYVARARVRLEGVIVAALREVPAAQLGEIVVRLLDAPVSLSMPTTEIATRFQLSPKEAAFVDELTRGAPRESLTRRPPDEGKVALAVLAALAITRVARESTAPPSSQRIPIAPSFTRPPMKSSLAPATPVSARPPISVSSPVSVRPREARASYPDGTPSPLPSGVPASRGSRPSYPDGRPSPVPSRAPTSRTSQPDGRESPVPSADAERLASEALAAAHQHVRVGRWSLAVPDITRALSYAPESTKALLYSRWTKMQMRIGDGITKQDRTELARLAVAATKADPEFGFAFYVAGDLALSDDDVGAAHRLLTKAVKLDPALADANRLLRIVDRRLSADAPPSSKRLFGKKLF